MRRSARIGFAIAILLFVIAGGYSLYWLFAAQRIESGVGVWAASLREHDLDLAWRTSRVAGFPFAFRLELTDVRLSETNGGGREVALPHLTARAAPWNFRVFRLAAPAGITATSGAGRPAVTIAADAAQGSIAIADDGGLRLWLGLAKPTVASGVRFAARGADLWLDLPPQQPQGHGKGNGGDAAIGLAAALHNVALPLVPAPLRNPIDDVSFALTLRGHIPAAPLRQAAAAWRDEGGTLDLDRFALRWGSLAITGSGTLALDAGLQPVGAFSGAVEGYQALMAALVAAGRVKAGDAQLAGLALALLSRTGPDGRPQIATSFTIQDGQMFLGPAKLGPAPRILWQ